MTEKNQVKNEQWFIEQIRFAESLQDVAETYTKVVSEIKEAAKELSTKRNTNGIKKKTTKPKDGKSVVTMYLGDKYELEVNTHNRQNFKIPSYVKAKYEVDPTIVKVVKWRAKPVIDE